MMPGTKRTTAYPRPDVMPAAFATGTMGAGQTDGVKPTRPNPPNSDVIPAANPGRPAGLSERSPPRPRPVIGAPQPSIRRQARGDPLYGLHGHAGRVLPRAFPRSEDDGVAV